MNTSPDWNAQEGEAGYIENKPFEKIIFDGIIESDNIIVYNYYTNSSSVYISLEGTEILHFTEYGEAQEITLDWPNIKIYWNGVDQITITNLSYESADAIKNYISVYGYNRRLLSSSIDDSVIKTFPQTLSDDNKNQALANLGINPVVWKYMMNPINVASEDTIPKELKIHIGDDVYRLKYPVAAMYTFNGILPIDINDSKLTFKLADDSQVTVSVGEGFWEL